MIEVRIKRISEKFPDIPLPDYATEGSSGIDIRACIDEPITIEPMETKLIPTNLIFEIPNGYEGQVRPRSGLAIKNFIGILNTPGTIDSDYRGELKIILTNFGRENFTVNRGDRIAQLVFAKTERADIKETDSLSETKRNSGGFGHTGVK